jgi:hypothetical protein
MVTFCGGSENFGEKMVKMKGGDVSVMITEWKDIPVELLMKILSLLDDQMVITASHVCHGWRDAISFGLTRLSLSWYIYTISLYTCSVFFSFLFLMFSLLNIAIIYYYVFSLEFCYSQGFNI